MGIAVELAQLALPVPADHKVWGVVLLFADVALGAAVYSGLLALMGSSELRPLLSLLRRR